jgi:hypothetical protein
MFAAGHSFLGETGIAFQHRCSAVLVPEVVAMLAEIFMLRLEAERRLAQDVLPSSASHQMPFSPKRQFAFKETNREGAEAPSEEPPVRLVR